MSEIINGKKVHSLFEFTSSIQRAIGTHYSNTYWLKAEISKLNFYPRSGHCYPEFSETINGETVATCTGFIHKKTYQLLDTKFLQTVGEPLHDGMKITMQCTVHFSTTRGLRLNVNDIDIDSILGEQTRLKQLTIEQLKSEGLFALNKSLTIPRLIKDIAVISVESGKGYADFMSIIRSTKDFRLNTKLFPALMMGPEAAAQIKDSLLKIKEHVSDFTTVCIIRGGGSENTLQCFNDLELCRVIATFPLPIMTGIGHATNRTIAEDISFMSFVSPSELAGFLTDRYSAEIARFNALSSNITNQLSRALYNRRKQLENPSSNLQYKFEVAFRRKYQQIEATSNSIKLKLGNAFERKHHAISTVTSRITLLATNRCQRLQQILENKAMKIHTSSTKMIAFRKNTLSELQTAAEPANDTRIMRSGKVITDIAILQPGDLINIILLSGVVTAEVKAVEQKK